MFGISGENFTFPVKSEKKINEAIWTKNKDKVAEWEGQGEPTYFNFLQGRSLLNKESGNLTIFKLKNSDNGTYTLELIFNDRRSDFLTFRLTVLGKYGRIAQRICTALFPFKKARKGSVYLSEKQTKSGGLFVSIVKSLRHFKQIFKGGI